MTLSPFDLSHAVDGILRAIPSSHKTADAMGHAIAARAQLSGAGNRRQLFSVFDELFQHAETEQGRELSSTVQLAAAPSGGCQLRRIELRNWKVFDRCSIELPRHDSNRPLILIGGKNGYGKTSLLEAMVLGLFGSRSFSDVDEALRLSHGGSRRGAYRQFMERAFHHGARERGDGVMSVELQYDTSDGPLLIERRWYFSEDGRLEEDDEELVLLEGDDRDLVLVPDGIKPNDHFQNEIARRLLPAGLAPFFFFDGEQIKRLGERQLSEQIRLGIESILGLPTFRGLLDDLKDYVRDRQREVGTGGSGRDDLSGLVALEQREAVILSRLAEIVDDLQSARERRDHLVGELGRLSGGTFADLQELLEQRKQNEIAQARTRHELIGVAAHELPLLLVGDALRRRLSDQLQKEEAAEALSRGAGHDEAGLSLLLTAFCAIDPPLDPDVEKAMRKRIQAAWQLRSAGDASVEARHHYLVGKSRRPILDRLSEAGEVSGNRAGRLTLDLAVLLRDHRTLDELIARKRNTDDRRSGLASDLQTLTLQIEQLEETRRDCDRELGEVRNAIAPLRLVFDRQRALENNGKPMQLRIERASELVSILDEVIAKLPRTFYGYFAEAITRAYLSLAHKGLIGRVDIDAEGAIRLTDKAGRDVQGIDPSAGEGQIFAMAIMAAVAECAGSNLPIVIDTPLVRLDPDHRGRILEYFSQRTGQTLLLSQPDEIHGRYLVQIESRVAQAFHLDHRQGESGPGISTIVDGYLPQVAA